MIRALFQGMRIEDVQDKHFEDDFCSEGAFDVHPDDFTPTVVIASLK